jgi:hypothetical protein
MSIGASRRMDRSNSVSGHAGNQRSCSKSRSKTPKPAGHHHQMRILQHQYLRKQARKKPSQPQIMMRGNMPIAAGKNASKSNGSTPNCAPVTKLSEAPSYVGDARSTRHFCDGSAADRQVGHQYRQTVELELIRRSCANLPRKAHDFMRLNTASLSTCGYFC